MMLHPARLHAPDTSPGPPAHWRRLAAIAALVSGVGACVAQQPATDTELSTLPTTPTPVATTPTTTPPGTTPPGATPPTTAPTPSPTVTVAYTPDMQPIFNADCTRCHSGSRPSGNYGTQTYAQVMRAVVVGDARSRLVVTTQSNGSMYRYFSGDRAARAALVRRWVVENGAAQQR